MKLRDWQHHIRLRALKHRNLLKRLLPTRKPIRRRMDGFDIFVRLDDWAVGFSIALRGQYEPGVTAVFRDILKPGMTAVDVGANVGFFSLLASHCVGPTGTVIAYEPGPHNRELIQRSTQYNNFNIQLHPAAVADKPGTAHFTFDDSNGQITTNPSANTITVPTVTLDDHLAHLPEIHLVKIDVEGAEPLVLQGMTKLLDQHHPALVIEVFPKAIHDVSHQPAQQMLDHLATKGYQLRIISFANEPLTDPLPPHAIIEPANTNVHGLVNILAQPHASHSPNL